MASVTFPIGLGGDGSTVTDDGSPVTGLAQGGHRLRFVPALAQTVAMAQTSVNKAGEALVSAGEAAASALEAAGSLGDVEAAIANYVEIVNGVIVTHNLKSIDLGSVSGTVTLDFSAANAYTLTASGNITLQFSNVPSGVAASMVVQVNNAGSFLFTHPLSAVFTLGVAPVLSTGSDILTYTTFDGGTTFFGSLAQLDAQ